jgi:hypothetical protein
MQTGDECRAKPGTIEPSLQELAAVPVTLGGKGSSSTKGGGEKKGRRLS